MPFSVLFHYRTSLSVDKRADLYFQGPQPSSFQYQPSSRSCGAADERSGCQDVPLSLWWLGQQVRKMAKEMLTCPIAARSAQLGCRADSTKQH